MKQINAKENKTRHDWVGDVDPKLVPRKENTEHGLEVRKIYKQKLQRIM